MDFDDFQFWMMAERPPDTNRQCSDPSVRSEPWSDVSDFEWMHSTEDEVDLGDGGVEQRLSRSLDMGHESLPEASAMPSAADKSMTWGDAGLTLTGSLERTPRGMCIPPEQFDSSEFPELQPPEEDTTENLKTKLMSAWNNVRYGWNTKLKTNFRYDTPIWLLGKCYRCSRAEKEEQKKRLVNGLKYMTNFDLFKRDFTSMLWFTYRREFPALAGTQLNSDVGWGCMLRSGQMMLAQALVAHFLSRDWRWYPHQRRNEVIFHHQIIHFFGDNPSTECPFSIHRLVKIGAEHGKQPGDWYGPASVAHVLREAMERAPECNPILGQLCLYVAQDCTVYKQDVIDLCTRQSPGSRYSSRSSASSSASSEHLQDRVPEEHWRALVVLIPVRLGGEELNPVYIPCVQNMLSHPSCLGIIGGKPKHSVYFVGWQEDKLIFLDPHFCQDSVDLRQKDFPLQTYHCMSPRKMAFTKMDPSCTLGFYCKNRAEFEQFVLDAEKFASPPKEKGLYPLFVFVEGRSIDLISTTDAVGTKQERYLRVHHLDKKGRIKDPSKDSDDFVFL